MGIKIKKNVKGKNAKGEVERYKARLVVRFTSKSKDSIMISLLAWLETLRLLFSAQFEWKIHELDVKSVILNGLLEEEMYIEESNSYVVKGHDIKNLDWLKQAPLSGSISICKTMDFQGAFMSMHFKWKRKRLMFFMFASTWMIYIHIK